MHNNKYLNDYKCITDTCTTTTKPHSNTCIVINERKSNLYILKFSNNFKIICGINSWILVTKKKKNEKNLNELVKIWWKGTGKYVHHAKFSLSLQN